MVNKKPVLIVVAGPNGSGKTTVTSKILHHQWMENSVYINPDVVAQEEFGGWNSESAVQKAGGLSFFMVFLRPHCERVCPQFFVVK